jgi:cytochrome c oxidase assembly factor CtaG
MLIFLAEWHTVYHMSLLVALDSDTGVTYYVTDKKPYYHRQINAHCAQSNFVRDILWILVLFFYHIEILPNILGSNPSIHRFQNIHTSYVFVSNIMYGLKEAKQIGHLQVHLSIMN